MPQAASLRPADRRRKFGYTRSAYMKASNWWLGGLGFNTLSVGLALISSGQVDCSASDSSRKTTEPEESCEPGIRNDEWNVDCSAA
ncbi:MAG TPA: hypothetical protein VHM25_21600, partial [Polyangiaceae bacterium]|nr:hypothetical protein [Polyangiaceae bacterium]